MKILGLSPLDKDATVTLMIDGKIVFAAGEERFSRKKQQDGFPLLAVKAALDYTGLSINDIDVVAYPFLKPAQEIGAISRNLESEAPTLFNDRIAKETAAQLKAAKSRSGRALDSVPGLASATETLKKPLHYRLAYAALALSPKLSSAVAKSASEKWASQSGVQFERIEKELSEGLSKIGWGGKVRRYDHHSTHAANAFYSSGFDKALCVTLDGYGTGLAGSVSVGSEEGIKRVASVDYPNSLGSFYEHVTSSLGFKPGRHEGKIVGLAAYGDPSVLKDVLLSRVRVEDGRIKIYQANNIYFARYLATHFSKVDVAAAYQHVLEVISQQFIEYWLKKTGCTKIVLSGGVTANVKLNQRIAEIAGVESVFVYPNMGDGGCGTGAAMLASMESGVRPVFTTAYLGPDFVEQRLEKALNDENLTFERPADLAQTVAELLHGGAVVARYDGRMEYGPRALGNRTIMYHGRDPGVNQWLNQRLGRTEFMPFAPVTLYEARDKCYHNTEGFDRTAEFMTITFDCTDFMKQHCPAAVHVDGTARPQLIKRDVNPGYYDIIKAYEALSGSPSVINTSFNMHEEPIVCSPEDAVRAFLLGELDYLILGPYLVKHPSKA